MNTIAAKPSDVKTTFAKRSPFTGKRTGVIDPDDLTLSDDPPPAVRASRDGKYSEIFKSAVDTGRRIKCEGPAAPKIATALKKFMRDRKIKGDVRSTVDYGDGMGGVWFIKPKD